MHSVTCTHQRTGFEWPDLWTSRFSPWACVQVPWQCGAQRKLSHCLHAQVTITLISWNLALQWRKRHCDKQDRQDKQEYFSFQLIWAQEPHISSKTHGLWVHISWRPTVHDWGYVCTARGNYWCLWCMFELVQEISTTALCRIALSPNDAGQYWTQVTWSMKFIATVISKVSKWCHMPHCNIVSKSTWIWHVTWDYLLDIICVHLGMFFSALQATHLH